MRRELGEIGDEQVDQLGRGPVILRLVGPGRSRVEYVGVDAGHRDRHLEAEVGVLAELGAVEAAVQRGIEQRRAERMTHDSTFAAAAELESLDRFFPAPPA